VYIKRHPEKILCLTEESVELLYLLKKEHLICGVPEKIKRPKAALSLPKIKKSLTIDTKEILKLNPDLVIGFGRVHKSIVADLVYAGLNVYIDNHLSIKTILSYIHQLGRLIGAEEEAEQLTAKFIHKIDQVSIKTSKWQVHPKVYFEEWNSPYIIPNQWVSEIIEFSGGISLFQERSVHRRAEQRVVKTDEIIENNPDIIFLSYCCKKENIDKVLERKNWADVTAVQNKKVFVLENEIFLHPGPALFLNGLEILFNYFYSWHSQVTNSQ